MTQKTPPIGLPKNIRIFIAAKERQLAHYKFELKYKLETYKNIITFCRDFLEEEKNRPEWNFWENLVRKPTPPYDGEDMADIFINAGPIIRHTSDLPKGLLQLYAQTDNMIWIVFNLEAVLHTQNLGSIPHYSMVNTTSFMIYGSTRTGVATIERPKSPYRGVRKIEAAYFKKIKAEVPSNPTEWESEKYLEDKIRQLKMRISNIRLQGKLGF
jgi:hypothetical protein